MELIELYKQYREEQLFFINEKIIKSLEDEAIMNSAIALDMLDDKGNIINDDPYSVNYILDFAIFEYMIDGKNAVERYAEKYGAENEMEERMLKALLESYTSLFRVVNISPSKHMVFLKDAFNQRRNIRLVDIASSQTMDTNTLIFARILPFPELNMTSGAPFVFPDHLEIPLTTDYRRAAGDKFEDNSTNKFIWFYNVNRFEGLSMNFHHTHEHHHHHDHDDHDHHHDHEHETGHHHHSHHHHDHDHCCGHDH